MKLSRIFRLCFVLIAILRVTPDSLIANQTIQLTLDSAVDIAINNSYRTKMIEMDVKRSMFWLKARQASLKTQVYMDLQTPDINRISDYKWNSIIRRNEIVRENTQRWESDLSIMQPVILFGYPTNGYLSLNYRLYRYTQRDAGLRSTDLYNRLYLKFEQPFFLPNELKNDLEDAKLNLQAIKLDYIESRVDIIESISEEFFFLFRLSYNKIIYEAQLNYLKQIHAVTRQVVNLDSSRQIENSQIELEITNVKENLLSTQSLLRRRLANIKLRLRLNSEDSLYIVPEIIINPINVNLPQAKKYGFENNPHLQQLKIYKRKSELDVEEEKGDNAFHLKLEMTYGLEKQNHHFRTLWAQFDNSNSITLNAYIPLWDGGERKARIQAEQLDVKRRELQIEQEEDDTKKDITSAFTNLNEYYQRAVNLKKSMGLAKEITLASIEKYQQEKISLPDLLQIVNRNRDTSLKFIRVYQGYRESLLDLKVNTYFNFEKNMSLLDEFDLKFQEKM